MFEQYAILCSEIEELTKKKDILKENIITDMQHMGKDKIKHAMGNFTITPYRTWKYPQEIISREDALKADKAKAQDTGEAVCEEKPSLRFTSIKL